MKSRGTMLMKPPDSWELTSNSLSRRASTSKKTSKSPMTISRSAT